MEAVHMVLQNPVPKDLQNLIRSLFPGEIQLDDALHPFLVELFHQSFQFRLRADPVSGAVGGLYRVQIRRTVAPVVETERVSGGSQSLGLAGRHPGGSNLPVCFFIIPQDLVKFRYRHQFHRGNAKGFQIRDLLRHAGKRPRMFHAGGRMHRKSADMKPVQYGVGIRDPGIFIVPPLEPFFGKAGAHLPFLPAPIAPCFAPGDLSGEGILYHSPVHLDLIFHIPDIPVFQAKEPYVSHTVFLQKRDPLAGRFSTGLIQKESRVCSLRLRHDHRPVLFQRYAQRIQDLPAVFPICHLNPPSLHRHEEARLFLRGNFLRKFIQIHPALHFFLQKRFFFRFIFHQLV